MRTVCASLRLRNELLMRFLPREGLTQPVPQGIPHEVTVNQEPQGPPEFETLTVRLSREMADQFRAIAEREDRPIAAELRRLIRQRIEEQEPNSEAQVA